MKVVLDANVFVSAYISGGKPHKLLERVVDGYDTLFITSDIVFEVDRVLNKPKFKYSKNDISAYVGIIKRISKIITVPSHININACRDLTDNKILECAVAAQANYIISGDNDLLVLDPYDGIRIVNTANYLDTANPV